MIAVHLTVDELDVVIDALERYVDDDRGSEDVTRVTAENTLDYARRLRDEDDAS